MNDVVKTMQRAIEILQRIADGKVKVRDASGDLLRVKRELGDVAGSIDAAALEATKRGDDEAADILDDVLNGVRLAARIVDEVKTHHTKGEVRYLVRNALRHLVGALATLRGG